MCRVGGPRCEGSHDAKERARERRRAGNQYRKDLAAVLEARGEVDVASAVAAASMTSMPGITEAMGLTPEQVSSAEMPGRNTGHRVSEKDKAAIAAAAEMAAAHAAPEAADREQSAQRMTGAQVAEMVSDPEWLAQSAALRTDWHAARERAEELADDRSPAGRLAHKDAVLDELVAQRAYEDAEEKMAAELREKFPEWDVTYDGATLGTATPLGTADEDTAEWHGMRRTGIGGSSVLGALGLTEDRRKDGSAKPMSKREYERHLAEMGEEKFGEGTDWTPREETGPAARGHSWEPALLAHYAAENPDTSVAISPTTWKGDEDFQVVNVDGIKVDSDGKPFGLIECKNSDASGRWEDGTPLGYRAQMLYYLEVTGLDHADLVSRVDGDVNIERIHRGETIDGTDKGLTMTEAMPKIREAWETAKTRPAPPPLRYPISNLGFAHGAAYANTAALLGISREEAKEKIAARKGMGESLDSAVRSVLAENFDRSRMGTLVGVDGETAAATPTFKGFQPSHADWIETGIVRHGPDGEETGRYSALHGADPRIIALNGTGAQDIHGIAPEDIEGKPRLVEVADTVRSELTNGDVIVAHNAQFEQRHLGHALDGIESEREWLDTAWLARHFSEPGEGRNGTLEHFCGDNGVEYVDAHRAEKDAEMMMTALERFLSRDNWWEVGR